MTQDKSEVKTTEKKRSKDQPPTKVVIRRLPPSLKAENLLEQLSPLPAYDYFYFMRADFSLGPNAFSRAYINFQNYEDIANFRDKFDNYIFVDSKGNEYPAIVEFSPFQKVPKRKAKKPDAKKGTIEQDSDYLRFLESLEAPDAESVVPIETYLEELEAKEKEQKATKGSKKVSTPLIEYLRKRREDKKNAVLRARDEKKKRELDKRKKEEERRRRREKDRERELQRQKERQKLREKEGKDKSKEGKDETTIKLLKNPDREKEADSQSKGDKSTRGDEGDKDSPAPVKPKDDRSKLRFAKENREKNKFEEKSAREKGAPADRDRPRSARDRPSSGRPRSARDGRPSPKDQERSKSDRGDRQSTREGDRSKSSRGDRWSEQDDRWADQDDRYSDRDRGNRPRSYREERARVSRERERESEFRNSGSSRKDGGKPDRDAGKTSDDKADAGKSDKDSVKGERDRAKKSSASATVKQDGKETFDRVAKPSRDTPKDSGKSETMAAGDSDQLVTLDDKKKRRKERPERAIYDPRKAAERRQGSKPSSAKPEGAENSQGASQDRGQSTGVK